VFELWYFSAEDTTAMGCFAQLVVCLLWSHHFFRQAGFDVVRVRGSRIQMLKIDNRGGGYTTVCHNFKLLQHIDPSTELIFKALEP
jgi:hypothetical protein